MVYAIEKVAAASAVAGYDIADGTWWQESAQDRMITKLGLVGSVNAGDTRVEIFFGQQKVLEYVNTLGGAPGAAVGLNRDQVIDMQTYYVCKAGVPIHVFVKDAATTNQLQFAIEMRELKPRWGYQSQQ